MKQTTMIHADHKMVREHRERCVKALDALRDRSIRPELQNILSVHINFLNYLLGDDTREVIPAILSEAKLAAWEHDRRKPLGSTLAAGETA